MSVLIQVGTIVKIDGYPGFWKVKGEYTTFNDASSSYAVIKCSKLGMEFKHGNGFLKSFIDCEINKPNGKVCYCGFSPVGEKADLDESVKSGKRKRRIQYLKAKIESMTKELENLEGEEQDAGN